jgi:hypothetical protein
MSNSKSVYMGGDGYEQTWNRVFGKKMTIKQRFFIWFNTEWFIIKERWYDFLYKIFIA